MGVLKEKNRQVLTGRRISEGGILVTFENRYIFKKKTEWTRHTNVSTRVPVENVVMKERERGEEQKGSFVSTTAPKRMIRQHIQQIQLDLL